MSSIKFSKKRVLTALGVVGALSVAAVAFAFWMVRFEIAAVVAGRPFCPASPMKNTRNVLAPLILMFCVVPLMLVLFPRTSGSSLVNVTVEPAMAFENVMLVPAWAFA